MAAINSTGVDTTLVRFRSEFPKHGEFLLRPNESINEVVACEQVSDGYGVYVIFGYRGADREIIYVGKAGTIQQDGSFKQQGIRKRLTMKQDGIYRKEFFQQVMVDRDLDALHFEWFVTFADDQRVPPFLAEAELLARFFSMSGHLPALNRCA